MPTTAEPALSSALARRLAGVVPAHLLLDASWAAIRTARDAIRQAEPGHTPSLMVAWCVVRAMEKHSAFRGRVQDNGNIAVLSDIDLGLSVALGDDRVATAVVPRAGGLDWRGFGAAYTRAVAAARAGTQPEVQAPLVLTSLGARGIETATPIVVPPAMGTLVVGQAHVRMIHTAGLVTPVEVVTLSLTFDHRVANGVGAAAFLHEVKTRIEGFTLPT
jgi:pyruvate/2-oxoglutarate dehydrogenase complex dihydrolipoamide acyltransferase (E2) component